MGRGKRDTHNFQCRISIDTIKELQQVNPSLITREPDKPDQIKFRHGALGRYVEALIRKDIRERKQLMQDDLLKQFTPEGKTDEEVWDQWNDFGPDGREDSP